MKQTAHYLLAWAIATSLAVTVMFWVWNWVVPAVFNGPTITWLESFGLEMLATCLLTPLGAGKIGATK